MANEDDTIRYLDENDNELEESDIDTSLGYITTEEILKEHHDAVEATPEEYHYVLTEWNFEDGTSMTIHGDNTDPHVSVIDDQAGIFEYVDQGEEKTYRGALIDKVIDVPAKDAQEEYDEKETIYRYRRYTAEELEEIEAEKEAAKAEQKLQNRIRELPDTVDELQTTTSDLQTVSETNTEDISTNTTNIEDLTILISEIIGMTDEEESEE